MTSWRKKGRLAATVMCCAFLFATSASAVHKVTLELTTKDDDLRDDLLAVSLIQLAKVEKNEDVRDILAAASADYNRLLSALYAQGYYSSVIHIYVDGREAAEISPLALPRKVEAVRILVDPGRRFKFSRTSITPLAPKTKLPSSFQPGKPALSGAVSDAATVAVERWRATGYARTEIASQSVVADHAAATLSAEVGLAPGPQVRLGQLVQTTQSAVRPERLREIANLPTGKIYSPQAIEDAATRLRNSGVFRSVVLSEAEALGSGNTLDIEMALVDEKPRRFGFGAEISTNEGLALTGFWLHRNLLGGAERLRIDGEIKGLGGQSGGANGGVDYALGARLDRPATFRRDTGFFALARVERVDEPNYLSDQARIGIGANRDFSKNVTGELGFTLQYSHVRDDFGDREFYHLLMPVTVTADLRNDTLDAKRGYYLKVETIPYAGLGGSASGVRTRLDGRYYRSMDTAGRFVLAGRVQLGSVVGSGIADTPPGFLFFSGGGGTVRGQPYQSLAVDQGGGKTSGGRSFVGLSGEIRAGVTRKIGVVAFADAGYIGSESFYDGSGEWHSGAGIGVRYKTAIGPVRLDVAFPTSGDTGNKAQFYIGIGQAF